MSERVEHKTTIEQRWWGTWYISCECGWRSGYQDTRDTPNTREEAVTAYQEHVYAAMGREASERGRHVRDGAVEYWSNATGDWITVKRESYQALVAFLDRQRAALEVEGA